MNELKVFSGKRLVAAPLAFAALLALTAPAATARGAETVTAPTTCSTGWVVPGANIRHGVTFDAPAAVDFLSSFTLPTLLSDARASANPVDLQIHEWDPVAGKTVGAPILVTGAATSIELRSGVPVGAQVVPGGHYVAHIPSVGPGGDDMALCAASVSVSGSSVVYLDGASGSWAATPWGTPGFSAVFLRQPRVTSVTAQAYPGETITVTGSGFDPVLTTAVTIGGAPAAFTVISPTVIEAVVPAGHQAGPADVQVTSDTLLSTISTASQVLVLAPAAPAAPASVTLGPPVIEPAAGSGPLADGAEGARGSLLPATGATGSTGAAILAALALVGGGAALAVAARRGRHGIPVAPIGAGGAHLWHDEH